MLQSFNRVLNSVFQAQDGKIGHLDDMLFDEQSWVVRYLVVKTGGFLSRERVLISPLGVAEFNWGNNSVDLHLTKKQIEESPDVDADEPVFRQMEKRYFDYYRWPYYWSDVGIWGVGSRNPMMTGSQVDPKKPKESAKIEGDPCLRSCREVGKYSVASDRAGIGRVQDFLLEEGTWLVRDLVVETKAWWHSEPLLVEPKSVQSIDWANRQIKLNLTKRELYTDYGPNVSSNAS